MAGQILIKLKWCIILRLKITESLLVHICQLLCISG